MSQSSKEIIASFQKSSNCDVSNVENGEVIPVQIERHSAHKDRIGVQRCLRMPLYGDLSAVARLARLRGAPNSDPAEQVFRSMTSHEPTHNMHCHSASQSCQSTALYYCCTYIRVSFACI